MAKKKEVPEMEVKRARCRKCGVRRYVKYMEVVDRHRWVYRGVRIYECRPDCETAGGYEKQDPKK